MNNLGRKIEAFIIVVIIAFIGIIYAFKQHPVVAPTFSDDQTAVQQQAEAPVVTTIEYQGQDGKNALDLLKASHQVEAKHYSFGDMVVGIDGITPDSKHFWAFYLNGSMAQVGASAYTTKSTDVIKWQLDEVKNYPN